jgi:hypothetical protein
MNARVKENLDERMRIDADRAHEAADNHVHPLSTAPEVSAGTGIWWADPIEGSDVRAITARGVANVPTRVLLCCDDRPFTAGFVRRVARERLGITPDEINGGHTPALSRP